MAQEVPSYGESSVEKFWWFRWMRYRADGTRDLAMTTYHSGDGWYLEIPESWTGDFSMSCQESATVGVRTITFALGVEGEEAAESEVKPFLQIYCLTAVTEPGRPGRKTALSSTPTPPPSTRRNFWTATGTAA